MVPYKFEEMQGHVPVIQGTSKFVSAVVRNTVSFEQCLKHYVNVVGDVTKPFEFCRKLIDMARLQPQSTVRCFVCSQLCLKRRTVNCGYGTFCHRRWHRNEDSVGPGTALAFLKRPLLTARDLSTSIRALQYNVKVDITKSDSRKFFFDTHAVVCLLEKNGFSREQSEVIVNALMRITNSNMDIIYKDMVTKVQQEIMLQRVMSQIAAVKKDMIILEKSEFSALLTENEKVKIELQQLKMQLADVMNKVRSDTILDLNLEKSRVKEMRAEYERKVLTTRTQMMEMNADQDRHMTQANMKIDTEVAGLKTMLESHKLDTIKYLAGSVFTCLTVVLGFYRIWM